MFTTWLTLYLVVIFYLLNVNACLPSINYQEKRDKEMRDAKREGLLEGLSKSEVKKKSLDIASVQKEEVDTIPDSKDEGSISKTCC